MMARSWLDDPTVQPALVVVPDPPAPTFRQTHLPEYSRRLLEVYAAVAGWPRGMVADLWPWVEWASACFEREDAVGWRGALAELERYTGVEA